MPLTRKGRDEKLPVSRQFQGLCKGHDRSSHETCQG